MKPFTTLRRDNIVVIWRNSHTQLSTVQDEDVNKVFTVVSIEYDGRKHNKYISSIFLRSKSGREVRATIDEIARCNPNFEPEGEYLVCLGCGSTMTDSDCKIIKHLNNMKACPSCGVLEPTVS